MSYQSVSCPVCSFGINWLLATINKIKESVFFLHSPDSIFGRILTSRMAHLISKSLSKSSSWDGKSMGSRSTSPARSTRPPFALDEDIDDDMSVISRQTMESTGYRVGGPKEARLHRVALLSKVKEIDHLHPVKVYDIPRTASPEKLQRAFSEFGEVGDVYIPMDYKERCPKKGFAIVRYTSPDSLDRLMDNASPVESPSSKSVSSLRSSGTLSMISRPSTSEGKPVTIDGRPVSVGPLEKQRSFFRGGTGYLGICNEPVEDGTYNRDLVLVQQDISLSSCLSRSGYPWGSVRELKFLAPHLPKHAYESFSIRIENLDRQTTVDEIRQEFENRYRVPVFVNCPKPLVVTQLIKDENDGFGFVRFEDRRDRDAALRDVHEGKIVFRGKQVTGKEIVPGYWPKESTRRYY